LREFERTFKVCCVCAVQEQPPKEHNQGLQESVANAGRHHRWLSLSSSLLHSTIQKLSTCLQRQHSCIAARAVTCPKAFSPPGASAACLFGRRVQCAHRLSRLAVPQRGDGLGRCGLLSRNARGLQEGSQLGSFIQPSRRLLSLGRLYNRLPGRSGHKRGNSLLPFFQETGGLRT